MRIKTFYTKTMPEALREIRTDLGPDALILSTKEIRRRSGVWGSSSGFEVVAAIDQSEDADVFSPSRGRRPGTENACRSQSDQGVFEIYSPGAMAKQHSVSSSVKTGKTKEDGFSAEMDASAEVPIEKELPFKGRASVVLYQDLVDCGVDASLARELVLSAWNCLAVGQRQRRGALVRSATEAALALVAPPSTQNGMPEKKAVAFVGPSGVGKTTAIAKLAAHLTLQKKKVVLMTLDGYHIGAIEQLQSYAGLMGVPFRYADQASELARVIEDNSQRDYVLIDTAGRSPRDMDSMHDLAAFLKQSEFIERHLVLSATTKPGDMRKIMDRFEVCRPDHLLFTKLDETSTLGPILNELVRTQKSFSYYTDGQRVPDDLHAVSRDRIIEIVLNRNENALEG